MWKQLDSTVDGFVDHVVTGTNKMKSMIGKFIPNKHLNENVLNYLPTETTRIKYIIRNPHTKETKVIKVRPSKKVIKFMSITPAPLFKDKSKSTMSFYSNKLREMEKEQEVIAESQLPKKFEDFQLNSNTDEKLSKYEGTKHFETVSGEIEELDDNWKPVQAMALTAPKKTLIMTNLHTNIIGKSHVSEKETKNSEVETINDFTTNSQKQSHTYEVTEYAAEESVPQPYTHELHNFRYKSNIEDQVEIPETRIESRYKKYSHKEQIGVKIPYSTSKETRFVDSAAATTTEQPNYPTEFLQELKDGNDYTHSYQTNTKLPQYQSIDVERENHWIPTNAARSRHFAMRLKHQDEKTKKWTADKDDHIHSSASFDIPVTTGTEASGTMFALMRNKGYSQTKQRQATMAVEPSDKSMHISQIYRGSVKYGDKL